MLKAKRRTNMLPRSCRTIRIDINSGKVRKSIGICQNDSIFPTLNFQLVEDGRALNLSDVLWAEIFIHKTDGYEVDNACVIDGDSIQYPLHSSDVSALGTNQAQLQLTFKDSSVLTTPTFEIEVYSKVLDQKNQQSTNDYTSLSQMLVRATTAVSEVEESASEADSSASLASEHADDAEAYALYAAGAASDAADTIGTISSMATIASENAVAAASDYASTSEMYSQVITFASEAYTNATAASEYAQSASEYASVAASETSNAAIYSSQTSSDAEATSEYASTASSEASEAESFMDSCSMYADAAAQSAAVADLQLGETSTTAYRGDKGKTAYDHSQTTGNPHGTTYSDVGADAAGSAAAALSAAKDYADELNEITVKVKGRTAFASLPNLANVDEGDMYNITDAFTSDSRFIDGGSKQYGAGSNVYALFEQSGGTWQFSSNTKDTLTFGEHLTVEFEAFDYDNNPEGLIPLDPYYAIINGYYDDPESAALIPLYRLTDTELTDGKSYYCDFGNLCVIGIDAVGSKTRLKSASGMGYSGPISYEASQASIEAYPNGIWLGVWVGGNPSPLYTNERITITYFGDEINIAQDKVFIPNINRYWDVLAAKPTVKTATLAAGSTSVTFTGIPTTGDYMIDFYTSTGINYTAINTATAGEITLTFDEQSAAVTIYCEIKEA